MDNQSLQQRRKPAEKQSMDANTPRLTIVAIITSLALTGCATKPTVSENQCRAGDWESIGYRDGANGAASTRILAHQDACGEYNIVPIKDHYLAGWQAGIASFCTPENGFSQGNLGRSLNRQCTDAEYAAAHADGLQLHQARSTVNALAHELESHHSRLVNIKDEMVRVSTAQLAPELTVQRRVKLLAKLEQLAEERALLRSELPQLELELSEAESRLAEIQQEFAGL